jgi:hypothetical protein
VEHVQPVYESVYVGQVRPAVLSGWELTTKTVEDLQLKEKASQFYEVASRLKFMESY